MLAMRQASEKTLLVVFLLLVLYPVIHDQLASKENVISAEPYIARLEADMAAMKNSLKQKLSGSSRSAAPHPEDWDAPLWEGEFFSWTDSLSLRDPKLENRPSLVVLVTALLRTVLQKEAKFWGRNPWGGIRVHIAPLHGGKLGDKRKSWVPLQWTTQTVHTTNATDFTTVMQFTSLTPTTVYAYVILLQINGTWHTHYEATFKTFPEAGTLFSSPLVFGFGSCITPNNRGTATGASLRLLSSWGNALQFFLFIGDFIYFWDELPHTTDEYNRYYYRRLMTREVVNAMRAHPWMFQFDDHEVHNDYSSGGDPSTHPYHAPAMVAWDNMIARANPTPNPPFTVPAVDMPYVRWYTYSHGNAHFFVADVRSFKVHTKDLTGQLLGEHQMRGLKHWLSTMCRKDTLSWCFFVSPTIFTHGSYRTDLWFGNMKEQNEVVKLMTAPGVCPVSILSGDSHMAGAYEVAPSVHEFTCSPVDAFGLFYPWAVPPRFAKFKKGKRPKNFDWSWPKLGDLAPPKAFFQHIPRHLAPAGFNCIIEMNNTIKGNEVTVNVRFDLIDGHAKGGRLLHTHHQAYSAKLK
eukprot:TRINITY_DN3015_c0_g1_i1.p1 TRINITY_DN3015_c0_g1~~TRINITY_DN3015_c0_g1_i1.p1  ORF type:complete len:575 (+),score=93.47 TRINITY_DN3015_c0_g1_i1:56-1780(+)